MKGDAASRKGLEVVIKEDRNSNHNISSLFEETLETASSKPPSVRSKSVDIAQLIICVCGSVNPKVGNMNRHNGGCKLLKLYLDLETLVNDLEEYSYSIQSVDIAQTLKHILNKHLKL